VANEQNDKKITNNLEEKLRTIQPFGAKPYAIVDVERRTRMCISYTTLITENTTE